MKTTDTFYVVRWNGRKRAVIGNEWVANCCGLSLSLNPSETEKGTGSHKGIKVYKGLVGKEYTGPKKSLTHIKTRNGNFTVSTQYVW